MSPSHALIVDDSGKRLSAAQWRRFEQVGLAPTLTLDELVLNFVAADVTDMDALGALVSINVARTIEGASTITMTLADPDERLFRGKRVRPVGQARGKTRKAQRREPTPVDEGWDAIVSPDVISKALEVELDGVVFRLVKVRASTAAQTLELTFEDRIVYWLKRKRGQRRADRSACTRAEFILSLLREVHAATQYRFVCPELHTRQPVDGGGSTGSGGGGTASGSKVLHVGDSLAQGTIPYENAYLGRGKLTGDGVVGRTSSETLRVLHNRLTSGYGVVAFDAGTNDDPSKPAALRANLDAAKAAAGARPLVVATLNRGNADVSALNATIKDFAQQTGVVLVDWGQKGDPFLSGDGTHPNAAGYKYRGKLFADASKGVTTLRRATPLATTRRRSVLAASAVATATATSSQRASGDDDDTSSGGFAPNASFTVAGGRVTPVQRRNLHAMLTECQSQGCSGEVMVAALCCVIQESAAKNLGYGDKVGPDSRGMFQQRSPWGPESVRLNPQQATRMFLLGGRGGQHGYKQANGSLQRVPGGIEAAVKAVQISVGGYAKHESEARRILRAWGGKGAQSDAASGTGAGGSVAYTKSYQFARNRDESSWTAMQRLAGEVAWRCFVVGNSVYYMSERDLYGRRARYEVTPDDPAVLDVSWDVDWGKTTSELELEVVLERWGAPPGSVVVLDGFGPPDGRWLVVDVSRDYFAPTATVSLKQPGKALLEPANERATRAANASSDNGGVETPSGGAGSKRDKLMRVCRNLHSKSYPYIWGGGHAIVGHPDSGLGTGPDSGPPPGFDCSGGTAAVLGALGLGVKPGQRGAPIHSSLFGRLPGAVSGRGSVFTVCFNGGHVYIRLEGSGSHYHRFDTAVWSGDDATGRGPRLRSGNGPPGDSGFSLCHWRGW